MARLVITHHRTGPSAVAMVRNLGEDLWREFRDEKRIQISLDDVDRAVDRIELHMKPALVPRARMRIGPILKRNMMDGHCTLSVED